MADGGSFRQFVVHQPKRKRAAVVCVGCHEKKIKCDLQEIRVHGYSTCSNCVATRNECRYRASNRDKRRRLTERTAALPTPSVPCETTSKPQNLISTPPLSVSISADSDPRVSQYAQLESVAATGVDDSSSGFAVSDGCLQHDLVSNKVDASGIHQSPQQQNSISQISPSELRSAHPRNDAADSYLGDTGFLELYGPETRLDADGQAQHKKETAEIYDLPSPELQQGFEETFFNCCSTWCPVLDKDTLASELAESPLLLSALAVAGSHVQPPMIPHAGPGAYYEQAKAIFYGDKEEHLIMCLKAIILIYWWSPRAPSRVHRDASWWWTTVAIRHAQHGGFHREPKPGRLSRSNVDPGLRRRIWWTLFARERLTSLCQDRPCVIDPEDCDVRELTLDDFPEKDEKAEIFIRWVQLCAIIGRVAKYLSRPTIASSSPFPDHLAKELIVWVQCLPENISLPIRSKMTSKFKRDVHQLHLPYLAVIVVLHLSEASQPLPKAHPPAILAASCIARIFRDCLARGRIRYMMAISCWYCGIALVPLLQARRTQHLAQSADEDIKILLIALRELRTMWPTANIFLQGFERLRSNSASGAAGDHNLQGPALNNRSSNVDDSSSNGIDWTQYFPFMTMDTNGLANTLMPEYQDQPFMDDSGWGFMTLNDLYDPFESYTDMVPSLHGI